MSEDFKAYRGDPNLKRAGTPVEWTPELIEEFIKCKNDILYFAEKYVKIVTEDGVVPIVLRDYQKELILSMHENRATLALQCRQSGKTEAMRCFALHYIIFNDNKTIALLANKGDTAREILGKIQIAYRNLPTWLQMGVSEWNKGSFVLENGSRIIAAATSSDAIRGYTVQCLMLDEFAFIENFSEFYSAVLPTISAGKNTKIICCTTPNGLNHAYKFWKDSEEGRNNFNRIFVPWWKVPGRDENWKEETLKLMGGDLQKFAQEQEVEFLGSSNTLIAGQALKNLAAQFPLAQENDILIYEYPTLGNSYVLVADVSEGKGFDYSAFHIIDVTQMPYKQVCVFRSNMAAPAEYADIINQMGLYYGNAAVLIENNNSMGNELGHLLFELEYENIIYTQTKGAKGKVVSNNPTKGERGLRTTTVTKAKGCSILKLLVEQQQLLIVDQDTIWELSRFSRKGRSYEAEEGATDDLVMGLVQFSWLTADDFFREVTDINTVARLREQSEQALEEKMMLLGISSVMDGEGVEEIIEIGYDAFDSWMMN